MLYAERQSTRGRDRERDEESERERQTRGSILRKNPAVTKRETQGVKETDREGTMHIVRN